MSTQINLGPVTGIYTSQTEPPADRRNGLWAKPRNPVVPSVVDLYVYQGGMWEPLTGAIKQVQAFLLPVEAILNSPPSNPSDGERYIIGTNPTGAWVSRESQLAEYKADKGLWEYVVPVNGALARVNSVPDVLYFYEAANNVWGSYGLHVKASDYVALINGYGALKELPAGESAKIEQHRQHLCYGDMVILGTLEIEGELVIL